MTLLRLSIKVLGYLVLLVMLVGEDALVVGLVNNNNDVGIPKQHLTEQLPPQVSKSEVTTVVSRRSWMMGTVTGAAALFANSLPANAAADCFKDCMKNCKLIAPKDPAYCTENCKDYCEQEDRTDGLSGSVSAESGEVGILGGTWGQGTVTKGEDKPPSISLPGLDFSSESGKKLIGY